MEAKEGQKENKPKLVDFGFKEGNQYFWWASWYADILGYKSLRTLKPSINKAIELCIQIGIPYESNFISEENKGKEDYKLSKFGCFLISLQADSRKPVVKRARAYFLNHLEEINLLFRGQDYLPRITGREEIKNLNSRLMGLAKSANVKDFQHFMNEGYLGMYNKTMDELKKDRGIKPHQNMSDFMSMPELSANIFRISLTTERLKLLKNAGEATAAREHWKIGSQIRAMIKQNIGRYPEELALSLNLNLLEKRLKEAHLRLNKELPA